MRTSVRHIFCSTFVVLILNSCGIGWKSIQSKPTEKLAFDSLPEKIKSIYGAYVKDSALPAGTKKITKNFYNEKEYVVIFVPDSLILVRHFNVSGDATRREFWPYGNYFKINKRKVFLPYFPSHPDPFIIDERYIYYPSQFNLTSRPYKNISYYRIAL
jgi:hypothetical protein